MVERDKAHIRLTVDIRYNLNGESAERMRGLVAELPHRLAGDGLMSGGTDAEVSEWSAKTAIVTN